MTASSPHPAEPCAGDVMTTPVLTCGPEMPVREVAATMARARVHALVVTGIEGEAWDVITALDLLAAPARGSDGAVARDVAATEALAVPIAATLAEAARLLVAHRVDHAVVADAQGRPAGIVSSLDLVARLVG